MNIAKLYGKWEGMEEVNKTNLVIGVTCLREYLLALGSFTKDKLPLQINITVHRQALAYLMGDTSGVGFLSVLSPTAWAYLYGARVLEMGDTIFAKGRLNVHRYSVSYPRAMIWKFH